MDTVISPSEVESQPDSYDPSWCRNRTMSKSQIHNWRNLTVNQAGDTVFCPSCKSFLNIAGWFGGIECTRKGGKHKVNPRNHTLGEEGIQSRCTIRRCKRPTSRLFLNEYQYQAPYSEEDLSGDEGPASVDTAENDSDHPVEPCEPGTHKLSTGRGTAHGRKDHNPATGSFIVTPRAILTCLTCGLAEVPIYSYETMRCPSEGPKNSGDARYHEQIISDDQSKNPPGTRVHDKEGVLSNCKHCFQHHRSEPFITRDVAEAWIQRKRSGATDEMKRRP